jgi:hypothetical protein
MRYAMKSRRDKRRGLRKATGKLKPESEIRVQRDVGPSIRADLRYASKVYALLRTAVPIIYKKEHSKKLIWRTKIGRCPHLICILEVLIS